MQDILIHTHTITDYTAPRSTPCDPLYFKGSEEGISDSKFRSSIRCSKDSKSIEHDVIQFSSRAISDPPISEIDFKSEMDSPLTTLKNFIIRSKLIESAAKND